MAIILNAERFRTARLKKAWSQEQLAEVCGVSVRTIQRLEQGGTASLETIKALAAGMNVSASTFSEHVGCQGGTNSDSLIKRVTPLTILTNIGPALSQYLELGFTHIETGDAECVGLGAGSTYLILATANFMAGDFRVKTVSPLVGRTIPYIYVRSIAEAKESLDQESNIIEMVNTRAGTTEAVVMCEDQHLILAAKI